MEKKVIGIVQARMGARRLPGKMMLLLCGHPVVEWIFRRVKKSKLIQNTVYAIPDEVSDDLLAQFLESLGASVFRGSESDLVDRFYQVAKKWEATHIVRVCADNPFISGSEIDRLIQFYFSSNYDYAYNHIPKNNLYPDGIGAEITSIEILETIDREATEPDHREHLFEFIWSTPDRFKIGTFDPDDYRLACPELKLDIDTQEDFERLSAMKVDIEMETFEIVAAAKALKDNETEKYIE
jgi:spore coat polysaccharide biosynthesis protein SpsF